MLAEAKNAKPDASNVPAAEPAPAKSARADKTDNKAGDKNNDATQATDAKTATADTDKSGKPGKTDKADKSAKSADPDKDAAKTDAKSSDEKSADDASVDAQADTTVQAQPQPVPPPQPVVLAIAAPAAGDSETQTDGDDAAGAIAQLTGAPATGAAPPAAAKPATPGKTQAVPQAATPADADTDIETADATGAKADPVVQALNQAKTTKPATGNSKDAAKPDAQTKSDTQAAAPQPPAPQPAQPQPAPRADALAVPAPSAPAPASPATPVTVSVNAAPATPTPDINSLAVEISAKSQSGAKQFEIRLDPPELGRVDVRLSIDATGKAQAHLSADQPQTLDLLQKDSSSLTQALRDAGLDVSQNGLNFSLRGQNQQSGEGGKSTSRGAGLSLKATKTIDAVQTSAAFTNYGGGNARLDIHV